MQTPAPVTANFLYYCLGFPIVSETFVTDQIEALLAKGEDVHILALRPGNLPLSTTTCGNNISYIFPQGLSAISAVKAALAALPTLLSHPAQWLPLLRRLVTSPMLFGAVVLSVAYLRHHPVTARLLICHFGTTGLVANQLRALGLLAMPQISVFHGFDISADVQKHGKNFYKPLFTSPTHTSLTITEFWRNRLAEVGDPAPVFIRLGVDLQRFAFAPHAMPTARPVQLLSVGRLTEKKGYVVTLHALAALPPQLQWHYHVIGGGGMLAGLKALAEELGIAARVTFHGAIPHAEVARLFQQSDAFILASHTAKNGDMEALPLVLLEAAACGLPVVTSNHSAIPELFEDGVTGLVAEEGDVATLTARLHTLLTQPGLWPQLTAEARKRVLEKQDFTKNHTQFTQFIRQKAGL